MEELKFFSNSQAAYRYGRSTCDHLLVLQEIFFHYRYSRKGLNPSRCKVALYLCFLDLRKAFDTVSRKLLFLKLKALGIQGKIYHAVKDLFSNTTAKVRVGDFVSRSFEIKSGVMQGSKLGPLLFLIFINDLLEELNASQLGVSLGKLAVSALGFSDDIVLLADTAEKLQEMINLCHDWSGNNGMNFNIDKCKIMTLNLRKPATRFYLAGKEIKFTDRYKYLGVTLSNRMQTSLFTHHISSILEKAEKRVNCIRHFGFQGDQRPV